MSSIESEKLNIEKIEKRIWQLVLLAVVVILYLSLMLLALQFLMFFEESEIILLSENAAKYSAYLSILMLLFCGYMIVHQRKLMQISKAFFRERESTQTLTQNIKTLSSLLEVSSSINSQNKILDILNIIAKEMLISFQADYSSIMLLDQESKVLKTRAFFGKGTEFVKYAQVGMGESVAGWVVENGKPLLLNGQVDTTDFPGTEKKNRYINSSLCVPLKIGTKSIGVLNVNLLDRDRTFSENDLKLITIFANNASVATQNAKLYDQIKRFNLQLEEKVKERTKDLEAANRAKSNFLANMSHELRTPLNAIIGFSEVLLNQHFGKLNEKQEEYIGDIYQSGKHLLDLINDILDLSKVEAGKIELEFSLVRVKDLIEDSLVIIKEKAIKHGLKLNVEIPETLSDFEIQVDERKLKQVLFNLLSNATKFTADGGEISLTANLTDSSKLKAQSSSFQFSASDFERHRDWLQISVQDTGIGIPPEDQQKIFNEFFQVKGGISDKTPGTGLGLPLTRKFIELHRGRIRVESEGKGKGSKFSFVLPIQLNA